jgi:2-polyprenyl-6-methoxyphenol hydroxylase-like FAD-dependent oxidoreductase
MIRTASSPAVLPHRHAVVIGSSMAGLLAARVLSDHFTQVTICERDPAPEAIQVRKGVPQGAHAHVLLKSGELIIEDLFPGIVAELLRGGTTKTDFAADVCWFHHGHWKLRYPSHLSMLCQSRPFLEGHLRRRLMSCANVTWRYETAILHVLTTADRTRVTGSESNLLPAAGHPRISLRTLWLMPVVLAPGCPTGSRRCTIPGPRNLQ